MKPIITAKDCAFIAAFALLIVGIVIGMMTLVIVGGIVAVGVLLVTAIMMYRRQATARRRAEEKRKAKHADLPAE